VTKKEFSMGDMVQVHLLTAYPAALLNRDDAGLAKRIPFGGAVRTRISSQCLKKHWREAELLTSLAGTDADDKPRAMARRSALVFSRLLWNALKDDYGASEEEAGRVVAYLAEVGLAHKDEGDAEEASEATTEQEDDPAPGGSEKTAQVVVLTRAETDFLTELSGEILEEWRDTKDLDGAFLAAFHRRGVLTDKDIAGEPLKKKQRRKSTLNKICEQFSKKLQASLDTALFGRMVTSDLFHRVDAAVSVAHAFTTHAEEAETDYFTAVDTLKGGDDDAGAGTIQDTELTTGVYYLYAVLDMDQLKANLVGYDDAFAEQLGRNLVQAMATVSPGAKKGSTAPYAYAELVLLERGAAQPRTLANAFLEPLRVNGANLMAESARELLGYRSRLASMHGVSDETAVLATCHDVDAADLAVTSLPEALALVFNAE